MRKSSSLLVILTLLLVSPPISGTPPPRVLVVCSDIEDVMMANSLGNNFTVRVLYLGKDMPDDRSLLSNAEYLTRYDEVWIPDLNLQWTYGGRLSEEEIQALMGYVKSGGILVIGLNTYVQHWNRRLDELFGVRLLRMETPDKELYIEYDDRLYPCNSTFKIAVVRPVRAKIVARYLSGEPAVTEARYGRGVSVLMTFNPVKTLTGNGSIAVMYKGIALKGLEDRLAKPKLSALKLVQLKLGELVRNPVFMGLTAFVVLFLMAYLGYLPWGVTIVLVTLTLPLSKLLTRKSLKRRIIEALKTLEGAALNELSEELGVEPKRLKFPVAVLKVTKRVELIDLSEFGERDVLITPRGKEIEGMAVWAISGYPKLMEKIARNPGVRVLDLAMSLNMPPYDVLETLKRLSTYGVVELRKIMFDYEVYPTKALARWFEI
ncbi:beta-galactosidase trimerization domain-containing protein [Thermococcus sp.]